MIVPVFILLWTTLLPLSVNCDTKCCNSDEQLIYSNTTDGQFVCAEKSEKRLDFFANSTSFLKTNRNGICYDILNSTFYVQLDNRDGQLKSALYALKKSDDFRKCCPINFVYNTRTHGCVQNISYLPEINVGLVSIGLPECRIIRDVVFNAAEEQTREASNAKEQHCTDGTDDGRFVLRICESSTDICKLGKCVRKCCPDGQSFVMGRHCRDTFEHGLNMSFSSRIIRPEGKPSLKNLFVLNLPHNLVVKIVHFVKEVKFAQKVQHLLQIRFQLCTEMTVIRFISLKSRNMISI